MNRLFEKVLSDDLPKLSLDKGALIISPILFEKRWQLVKDLIDERGNLVNREIDYQLTYFEAAEDKAGTAEGLLHDNWYTKDNTNFRMTGSQRSYIVRIEQSS